MPKKIKDTIIYLLHYEGTPTIGIRIVCNPRDKEFFENLVVEWSDIEVVPEIAIKKNHLEFTSNESQRYIVLTDNAKKVIDRLLEPHNGAIQNTDGWHLFLLTDGTSGLNIISPECIKMGLHLMNAIIP